MIITHQLAPLETSALPLHHLFSSKVLQKQILFLNSRIYLHPYIHLEVKSSMGNITLALIIAFP